MSNNNNDNDCPCSYCAGKREERHDDDLFQYTVKCGYRGIEDLDSIRARIVPGRFPRQPDRISCPCKGCGGNLEEIVGVQVIKAKGRK
jgi:hypothetical protein